MASGRASEMRPAPSPDQPGGSAPSPWVSQWCSLIKSEHPPTPPSVLDVACGHGRHMRHLTYLGMRCTGIDRDAAALRSAQSYGQVVHADIENGPWPLQAVQFDAVVVTHYLWRPLMADVLASIRPGGLLIYQTFSQAHAQFGRPSRPEFLLAHGELLDLCQKAQMHIVAYEDLVWPNPQRALQGIVARAPRASASSDLNKT